MSTPDDLFPGFQATTIDLGDVSLHYRIGGSGPPLVVLHGYPESHAAWHRVAPALAEQFTVVTPDLRGYGQSSCPPSDSEHRPYAKRTMAGDVRRLMRRLGHASFRVVGHDRGARVAYRLALDHQEAVERLVLLDIVTTFDQWRAQSGSARRRLFHWNFLAQSAPIPEALIGANPGDWVEARFRRATKARSTEAIDPRVLRAYRESLSDPDRIHASCEDYRAGAGCDLADDSQDRAAGRQLPMPTQILWGTSGNLADVEDPLAVWRPWCRQVEGAALDCGHFIPEEHPAALLATALPFLSDQR
jgi:haloacetate dehalogenase